MPKTVSFVVVALLLVIAFVGTWRSEASAQIGETVDHLPTEGMIALDLEGNEAFDLVALVDPVARVMSVYQIDRNSGEITLRSVRNVTWDLELDEFNGTRPTPREVRSQVQAR
ncbi:MAG: hypothetical protein R3B96_19200 [Pirellulaceae bacterium]|nr:hypothetical protein [Planctomycetales bacterium]